MSAQTTISGSSAELRNEASHGPRSGLRQNERRNGPASGIGGYGGRRAVAIRRGWPASATSRARRARKGPVTGARRPAGGRKACSVRRRGSRRRPGRCARPPPRCWAGARWGSGAAGAGRSATPRGWSRERDPQALAPRVVGDAVGSRRAACAGGCAAGRRCGPRAARRRGCRPRRTAAPRATTCVGPTPTWILPRERRPRASKSSSARSRTPTTRDQAAVAGRGDAAGLDRRGKPRDSRPPSSTEIVSPPLVAHEDAPADGGGIVGCRPDAVARSSPAGQVDLDQLVRLLRGHEHRAAGARERQVARRLGQPTRRTTRRVRMSTSASRSGFVSPTASSRCAGRRRCLRACGPSRRRGPPGRVEWRASGPARPPAAARRRSRRSRPARARKQQEQRRRAITAGFDTSELSAPLRVRPSRPDAARAAVAWRAMEAGTCRRAYAGQGPTPFGSEFEVPFLRQPGPPAAGPPAAARARPGLRGRAGRGCWGAAARRYTGSRPPPARARLPGAHVAARPARRPRAGRARSRSTSTWRASDWPRTSRRRARPPAGQIAGHARPGVVVASRRSACTRSSGRGCGTRPPGQARTLPYRLAGDVRVHPWAPAELAGLFEAAGIRPLARARPHRPGRARSRARAATGRPAAAARGAGGLLGGRTPAPRPDRAAAAAAGRPAAAVHHAAAGAGAAGGGPPGTPSELARARLGAGAAAQAAASGTGWWSSARVP